MEVTGTEYPMGEIAKIFKMELKAISDGVSNLVPIMIGDPGTGKTESLKAIITEAGYLPVVINTSAKPYEGWSGIPELVSIDINPEYSTTGSSTAKAAEWSQAEIIAYVNNLTEQALARGLKGVVVILDDIHLVDHMIQKYLFEFLQSKTLQGFKLHPKALLVGAMNGKESAGMEGFLSAIIDRMAMYYVKFDKEHWYDKVGYSVHPYVASFSKGANDRYFQGANAIDGSSPSPRSWTELANVIGTLEEEYPNQVDFNHMLRIVTEARVGREAAVEFMKHVKLFQKFDFASVLAKKDPNFLISSDISDQIILSFIIRYVASKDDVDYLITVLNKNKDRRTFISVLINEYDVILKNIKKMQESKEKEAFLYLMDVITDDTKVDEELLDTIIDGVTDMY